MAFILIGIPFLRWLFSAPSFGAGFLLLLLVLIGIGSAIFYIGFLLFAMSGAVPAQ